MLPETAGSLLGMGVVGKSYVHIKNLGGLKKNCAYKKNADENDNVVTITVPYMVVTRSFR